MRKYVKYNIFINFSGYYEKLLFLIRIGKLLFNKILYLHKYPRPSNNNYEKYIYTNKIISNDMLRRMKIGGHKIFKKTQHLTDRFFPNRTPARKVPGAPVPSDLSYAPLTLLFTFSTAPRN